MSEELTPVRCDACGQFIGGEAWFSARCSYTPLSEFSPEILEWVCGPCVKRESEGAQHV